jgi:23S rRNA (uracil1939-C5)-methyltransferase
VTVCRHFGACGGCTLQDLSPEDYRAQKRNSVVAALARVGLNNVTVEEPVMVPPYSRRRAVFKLARTEGGLEVGFHARQSHDIIDMQECLVLTPRLLRLTETLRAVLTPVMNAGEKCELHATDSDTGLDLAFRWERKLTPALTSALAKGFAGPNSANKGIARVLFNKDIVMENAPPTVRLGDANVMLPPHAFLQATREGEAALRTHMLELTQGAKIVADLFAGLGTFSLALARQARVHAVEQDAAALAALAAAARATSGLKPVTTEKRDLFKQPLTVPELKAFDALVLDPPRAGAEAQMRQIAASNLRRLVYVSCDAASFARDAALLAEAGFKPGAVTPIDQFLWSGHIELVAGFQRRGRP